jgi:hypothetical protein
MIKPATHLARRGKKSAIGATTEINFPSRRLVAKKCAGNAFRTREALLKS